MARMRNRLASLRWLCPIGLMVSLLGACSESSETLPLAPIPLVTKNGLLYALGDMMPTLDERCAATPEQGAPAGSGAAELLIDTGTPLTTLVPSEADSARQFPHAQISFRSVRPDGSAGGTQFLRCNVPVVRSDLNTREFQLRWDKLPALPLGGVFGGDQLSHFAMSLRFSGTAATMLLSRGDIATWCRIDRAVLPFKSLGGELAVQLADTVITYPASRITVGACVEPLANPLTEGNMTACVSEAAVSAALLRVSATLAQLEAQSPRDEDALSRQRNYQSLLIGLKSGMCPDDQRTLLGDLAEDQALRHPAYTVSGTNMRFLVSTAIPELLLTQTACRRLTGKACTCEASNQAKLALPGLNTVRKADGTVVETPDLGCRIKLGDAAHAALALVAKQKQLSPCDELARSRRQRYALRPAEDPTRPLEGCLREACLRNLGRDPSLIGRRCGYTQLDTDLACNDKLSPVASWIELGGPTDGGTTDELEAVVLPDSAPLWQSINADIRNLSAQIDGIIGVATLRRMFSIIDSPQGRMELACRCDLPTAACHAYRAVTYYTADTCVESDVLTIPANLGRTACER